MTGLPPSGPGDPGPGSSGPGGSGPGEVRAGADGGTPEGTGAPGRLERRRRGGREFRAAYPGLITGFWLALVALLAADGWLAYKGREYGVEAARLRHAMTGVERQRADVVFAANKDKVRVIVELARRQAEGDRDLHLSVAVDSGAMYLEREGALLREMPVRVGGEQMAGTPPDTVRVAAPRGMRTVSSADSTSVTLDGGTTIYAVPGSDDLSDSAGVTAGNVRARATDLQAILPNLKPGMSVYFY
ncbi:MAG: hypothetical protein ACHQTF_05855 [Gemmatimonadales bacterium]